MAEQVTDSLFQFARVVSSLREMTEPKKVSTSITKDGDGKVKPTLDSAEQARFREIAKIFGTVLKIGAFKEGPEAPRLGDLTPQDRMAMQARNLGSASKVVQSKLPPTEKESSLPDFLSWLPNAATISAYLKKQKDKIIKWFGDKLSGIGRIFSRITKSIGDKLKTIRGKIGKSFTILGEKIGKFFSWSKEKLGSWAESILTKVKNTKIFATISSKIATAKLFLQGIWDNVISSIDNFAATLGTYITKVKDAALKAVNKIPGVKAVSSMPVVQSAATGARSLFDKAWNWGARQIGTAQQAATGIVDDVTQETVVLAKKGIRESMSGLIKQSGGAFRLVGKIAKRVPILGPMIESAFTWKDIQDLKSQNLSQDDLQQKAGARVITGVSGLVGSVGGAALMGALGSLIPGAGTLIGTLIGSVGGDMLGRFAGELISEYLLPPKYTKSIGAYVTGTQPPMDEMQDFIIKNGRVYKFSSKDEVMGMKTGGAIDNLFTSFTQTLARDNSIIRDASIAQVNKLDILITLLSEYLSKTQNRVKQVNTNIDTNIDSIPNKPFDIRKRFSKQTLIPTQPQLY